MSLAQLGHRFEKYFRRASRMLVRLDRRAVDEVLVPIQLAALLGQLL